MILRRLGLILIAICLAGVLALAVLAVLNRLGSPTPSPRARLVFMGS